MMKSLVIRTKKEYLELVPRPSKEDYKSLKNSIKEDGLHLPITVNQNGVILDGHTRNDVCKELGVKPIFEVMKFDDEFDEKRFVVTTNLSRRSLNLFQKGEILQVWWNEQRELGFKARGSHTWKTRRGKKYKTKQRLHMQVAKMLGCGHTTAYMIFWLINNAPEKIKRMLRKGTITIGAAYTKLYKNGKLVGYCKKYNRSNQNRYPVCIRCESKTAKPEKTKCHVHTQQCCTECGWGF